MIQSISQPDLFVTEDGRVFKDGERLAIQPGVSSKGPVVSVKRGNLYRTYSIQTMVYEVFVKKEKRLPGEKVIAIDGDEYNCHANNLKSLAYSREERSDKPQTWMNGDAELYC